MKVKQQGFTLLEILLVVLIMSLAAMTVSLNFAADQEQTLVDKEAKKLAAILESASQQAVLGGLILGIEMDDYSYQLVVRNPDYQPFAKPESNSSSQGLTSKEQPKWIAFDHPSMRAESRLAEGVIAQLKVEGLALAEQEQDEESWLGESTFEEASFNGQKKQKKVEPQILILPSGEMSAFELVLSWQEDDTIWQAVNVDAMGRVKVGRELEDES